MCVTTLVTGVLVLGLATAPGPQQSSHRSADNTEKAVQRDAERLNCGSASMVLAAANVVVVGRQVAESDSKELYVDTSPCNCKTISFHEPYEKEEIGTVTCKGEKFKQIRAKQNQK